MLKYKIKANAGFGKTKLDLTELFISPDLRYISGVADYYSDIRNGDKVIVEFPQTEGSEQLPADVTKVTRQGYLMVDENYDIKSWWGYNNFAINTGTDASGNTITYITYNNSKYIKDEDSNSFTVNGEKFYYGDNDAYVRIKVEVKYIEYDNVLYFLYNNDGRNGFLINDVFYPLTSSYYARIPTKHWIEDGTVEVKGITYYVDTALVKDVTIPEGYIEPTVRASEFGEPLTAIGNNFSFTIHDYGYEKWHNVLKVIINTSGDKELFIDSNETGYYQPYITYGNENYNVEEIYRDNEFVNDEGETINQPVSLGFGVMINNIFYKANYFYENTDYPSVLDGMTDGFMDINGNTVDVYYKYVTSPDGNKITLFLPEGTDADLAEDSKIIAINKNDEHTVELDWNEEDGYYVLFNGEKYDVIGNLCDTITIYGEDYDIEYIDYGEKCVAVVDNERMVFDVQYTDSGRTAIYDYNVAVITDEEKNLVEVTSQSSSVTDSSFTINEYSGVSVNGVNCRVYSDEDGVVQYADIYGEKRYELNVFKIGGSQMIICDPVVGDMFSGKKQATILESNEKGKICRDIADNITDYAFFIKNESFGFYGVNQQNAITLLENSTEPQSSNTLLDRFDGLVINKVVDYTNIHLPINNKSQIGINHEDMVTNGLVNDVIGENLNDIVDMEKDVYYPVYLNNGEFDDIREIRFNLHFRTRDKDSWKINEERNEEIAITKTIDFTNTDYNGSIVSAQTDIKSSVIMNAYDAVSNWFVIDTPKYRRLSSDDKLRLHNSSDLLTFANFNDDDVKYQKKRLKKSFLRLSFYSTNNPQDQMLLATSTIFVNPHELFNKKMKYIDSELTFDEIDNVDMISSHTLNVDSEEYADNEYVFDTNTRLDTRLTVKNKYETSTSSEGFYLYMFKEYSTGMRPSMAYLKIDFYHAGIGRMFPLTIPMITVDEYIYRPAFLSNDSDVEALKQGIPMDKLNEQMFIPVNLIYDDKRKRYVYYLPDNYRENEVTGVDNNIMEFNLFEIKIADESNY